jgi:DNA-binding beta-propeller fold protein YncE
MTRPARRFVTPALLTAFAALAAPGLSPGPRAAPVPENAPPQPEMAPARPDAASAPAAALASRALWDRDALEAAGIRSPQRLLYGPDGTLYVLDGESRRVVALDPAGHAVRAVGGYGSDEASLQVPVDLVLDRRGSLLVLDRGRGAVVAFDPAGRFLTAGQLTDEALEEGRVPGARLLQDRFGSLWLLATSTRDVMPLDDRLGPARLSRFLQPQDSLVAPALAAFAPSGDVWVYDAGSRALRRFGSDGRFRLRAPPADSAAGPCEPADLATDASGALYVADPAGQRILVVAPSGAPVMERILGGASRPWRPAALATSAGGLIAVADAERDEIQILSIVRGEAR